MTEKEVYLACSFGCQEVQHQAVASGQGLSLLGCVNDTQQVCMNDKGDIQFLKR